MSFFDRQPAMFDAKKKLGTIATVPNVSERTSDDAECTSESWEHLAPSRASLCSSVEAVMVDRDGGETTNSGTKDSRLSPVSSLQSPQVEFDTDLQQVKDRLVKDMLPPGKNTDWIWDWSSRPEAIPPKMARHRSGQIGSTLTTPPNSPEPENSEAEANSYFDYSPKAKKKSSLLRFEVICGLVLSNLITFFVGATVGFCVCKKLAKNQTAELH